MRRPFAPSPFPRPRLGQPVLGLTHGRRGLRQRVLPEPPCDIGHPGAPLARAPPHAMPISYLVARTPGAAALQTEPALWQTGSLQEAWARLHRTCSEAEVTDPLRARRLRANDLVALARCTSYAETRHLLAVFPPPPRAALLASPAFDLMTVEEFFVHVGQPLEARGGTGWVVQLPPPSPAELRFMLDRLGGFGEDGRGTLASTAHRIALWRGRRGEPLGLTLRVGRFVPNAARALCPLLEHGSLLVLARAGTGKTTVLRDLAASLAGRPGQPRVVVVDTSNEIGGDGAVPMPFLGRCRRLQVPRRGEQSRVMLEAVQNHTPAYLVVDELATREEAEAAWSIANRGVRLVASCHGESLAGLVQNPALNVLVGGVAQAFLSHEERRLRNKTKKTVLERPYRAPFQFVLQLATRERGYLYHDVNTAVDLILDEQTANPNAAVGTRLELSQPLPPRVERLLRKPTPPAPGTTSDLSEDMYAETEDMPCPREGVDENGYLVLEGAAGGRKARTEPVQRRR